MKNKTAKKPKSTEVLSHWPKLIENLKFSPQEFYTRVEQALAAREIPDLQILRVDWKEGGLLSARREYLRLQRERLIFDICGAPFGTGFFVSIWCGERPLRLGFLWLSIVASLAFLAFTILNIHRLLFEFGVIRIAVAAILIFGTICVFLGSNLDGILIRTPAVGYFYERFFRKITFYRIDRTCMYQQAVHAAVTQVIDEITKSQGLQPLSEFDRRPIMRELFAPQGSDGRN